MVSSSLFILICLVGWDHRKKSVIADSFSFLGWRRDGSVSVSKAALSRRVLPFFVPDNTHRHSARYQTQEFRKGRDFLRLRGGSSYNSDSENENEEEYMSLVGEDDEDEMIELDNVDLIMSDDDLPSLFEEEIEEEIDEEMEADMEEEYETFPLSETPPDETSVETNPSAMTSEEESNHNNGPNTESGEGIFETTEIDDTKNCNDDKKNFLTAREKLRKENRHTSDVILELDRRSSVSGNDESLALRQLITTRTTDYVYELQEEAEHYLNLQQQQQQATDEDPTSNNANDVEDAKLPHPRKLLHSLAKKVPAIKQSPDVNLRIHSSRADIDPGVAACIIGRLAFACEQYEQVQKRITNEYCDTSTNYYDDSSSDPSDVESDSSSSNNKPESVAPQLTTDRRFEQLVECVISGVNIKKRKAESLERELSNSTDEIPTDIEEVLDEEDARLDEGLNIRDACRAAWGIAILGAHYLDTMGGVKVNDLLLALSLRIRELLLARLQLLRQGDILSSGYGMYYQDCGDGSSSQDEATTTRTLVTTEERLNELAEELAEDAASAMWAFGCVKACTGMKSSPLFEACCSILCQDPVDLRRRAQEAEYEPDKVYRDETIGSSDVVDRLALSEAAEATEEEVAEQDELPPGDESGSRRITTTALSNNDERSSLLHNMGEKDAFLDWLSPVEVTDILWALALHGSNSTSKDKDEITLSETASTLRETAYDRLVEWLEEDLDSNEKEPQSTHEPSIVGEEPSMNEEVTVVEVVDAAALLASEVESSSKGSLDDSEETNPVPTESIAVKTTTMMTNDINSQEVEVVDAAKLLASMDNDDEIIPVETEVMVAPTSVIEGSSIIAGDVDAPDHVQERISARIFSPHDLASIAWSVTELRDPLRIHIVGNIIELLWRLGPDGISDLSGTDLSNLAWAIAKYEGENHDKYSLSITRWIADDALQRTAKYPLFRIFQPPELGRIMWAIACTASTHNSALQDATGRETSSFFLTRKALKAAGENLTLFSTETLVRIAWAHLEINESNLSVLDSFETMALGKILAAAEHSLHRWERVDFANDFASIGSHVETPLFSSFFGRPRINLPILEQAVNDANDEDDMVLAPLGRSQRPKLRDLMIDPSTLCKAACGFQRLSKEHPYIKGGWTLTRVAVRLLSSKHARLMKECSIHDIVRLCEAAVLSDVDGHGRELIIGLFAREVVKVLNEVLEDESRHETSIDIASASSTEISTLIWTLGEMGVKYSPGKQPSSKKMRLTIAEPLLQGIRVKSLNQFTLERLIRGLVLMKMAPSQQPFLLQVLTRLSEKLPNVSTGNELCSIAESIGILKEASKAGSATAAEPTTDEAPPELDENEEEEEGDSVPPAEEVQKQIASMSDQMLNSIATLAMDSSKKLTANEIRRLLEVYSLLPYQADEMVACLSEEISNRLEAFQNLRRDQTLVDLVINARKKSSVVRSSLFEDSKSSLFGSMKSRIFSLFGLSSSTEEDGQDEVIVDPVDDEGTKLTEEIASLIQDSISASSDAAHRAKADESALQLSLDGVIKTLEEGAAFELGRSQELIENYNHIEFATGERRSRYDKHRKNYITKRVLSRLLP